MISQYVLEIESLVLLLFGCHPPIPWKRGALVVLAAVPFCNNPEFLSGTLLDKEEERKRAEALLESN